MYVQFKRLSFKNFLSVGNAPVEIDLLTSKKTLIVGANGQGKSTILSALSFVLFNRPIKSLNKPALVNSINNKNCVVEIEFKAGKNEYKIIRGIKPNIFEIIENGKLLDQTAMTDYQVHLEEKILQTNFKAFTQTTVISIENYVPFMKLKPYERRTFIEELLDIKVFSTMNTLLKQHMTTNREELALVEVGLKSAKEKVLMQKQHIAQLESIRDKHVAEIEERVAQYEAKIEKLQADSEAKSKEVDAVNTQANEIHDKIQSMDKYKSMMSKLQRTLDEVKERQSFYHDAENCPTCKQNIAHDHKQELLLKESDRVNELNDGIEKLQIKLQELTDLNNNLVEKNRELNALNKEYIEMQSSIREYTKMVKAGQVEISTAKNNNESINEQKEELKKIAKNAMMLTEKRTRLKENTNYYELAYGLLKDTGIKAKIIKQYVPVINKYVNKYLAELDFFVSFELDENFNESIKSRHRDTFTYFNFSAGEQQRIDLALMFTFRQIAKMKNSFNSNLLCLDEVLDRVDTVGFEMLLGIFESDELKGSNIQVITHKPKDALAEIFDTTIEMSKDKNGFTEAHIA